MTTANPFDLLGSDDSEDPSLLAASQKILAKKTQPSPPVGSGQTKPVKPANLPSKPLPPAQAVKEAREGFGRGGGRGGGRSSGRGRGFNRDSGNYNGGNFGDSHGFSGGYNRPSKDEGGGGRSFERRGGGSGFDGSRGGGFDASRGSFNGGRRGGGFDNGEAADGERPRRVYERRSGGFDNGEAVDGERPRRVYERYSGGFDNGEAADGERPRRVYERRSGTGRGNEFKRDGSGRGNWGAPTDEIAPEGEEPVVEIEKDVSTEKPTDEDAPVDANKSETEEKEPEDKEMTLEEYEKVLNEKRKPLLALKTEVRKAAVDDELVSMLPLSNKKQNDEVFVKLGSDKDKRKEAADKEEKAKKSVSINEFLKPADGDRFRGPSGRGRGRGRGSRAGYGEGSNTGNVAAPLIEDPRQFPTLGGK